MPHHMENLALTLTHNKPHHMEEQGAAALIRNPLNFSSLAVEPSAVDWSTLQIHHASPANMCEFELCWKRKNTRKHKNNHSLWKKQEKNKKEKKNDENTKNKHNNIDMKQRLKATQQL